MNSITIAGQLGKDAELRSIPSGEQVLSFSVADSQGRDKPTIWWSCALWGKRAASLQQYLVKGQAVTVTGTITERAYTDKNGLERKAQDIRVNDLALQGGKREGTVPAMPYADPVARELYRKRYTQRPYARERRRLHMQEVRAERSQSTPEPIQRLQRALSAWRTQ
jgi:single-strand DNA-binding protein